jgi:rhamnogalacturonan endolyase
MIFIVVCFGVVILCGGAGFAQRQMERLGRGVVAVPVEEGKVYVGWRLLGTEPEAIAFNLYRVTDGASRSV